MNGLSETTDLRFLQYKQVGQICLSIHQVILRCPPDVTVSVESTLEYIRHGAETGKVWTPGSDLAGLSLETLLGQMIKQVEILPKGTLKLLFSSNDTLVIHDDNKAFESYQLTHGSRCIVV